jgi:hypothetical protein
VLIIMKSGVTGYAGAKAKGYHGNSAWNEISGSPRPIIKTFYHKIYTDHMQNGELKRLFHHSPNLSCMDYRYNRNDDDG